MKLFSEIYNTYYNITEKLLKKEKITKRDIHEVIQKYGFSETALFLEPKLTGADGFGLLNGTKDEYRSILKKEPHIPLTTLEKRWLCAVLNDRKCGLFLDNSARNELLGMLGEKPLFNQEQFCFFDCFSDGDDYESEAYIRHFRDILYSIHNKTLIMITFNSRRGSRISHYFLPVKIEYSSKNDRFRVHVISYNKERPIDSGIINLAQITETKRTSRKASDFIYNAKREAVIRIINERNAVNRFMMEFAELERTSEYDETTNECLVKISYNVKDEIEILIRLLSFGPMVEVVKPQQLRDQIIRRIQKQYKLLYEN